MKYLVIAIALFTALSSYGQELINGSYDFQTDPSKDYTLYIPSSYEAGTPTDMMVGLHPLNTNRWNGNSWCDTLKTFAEANNLLLVCPDGGADGRIDDAIDTAFTTFLIDEVRRDYSINDDQIYAIGFSWGAKTVYTYGLQHANRFAGFIPVGAAVTSSEVAGLVDLAVDKKFYVVHGSADSPNVRYTPIINLLQGSHCVESRLLSGVGHTIDFPDRNAILTEAFQFVKASSCGATAIAEEQQLPAILINNSIPKGMTLPITMEYQTTEMQITDMQGKVIASGLGHSLTAPLQPGQYFLLLENGTVERFLVY